MYKKTRGWAAFLALLCITTSAWAAGNVLFILDASGSMRGKLGGQVKMEAAKSAFHSLLAGMPKDANVGLEVYGHRGNRDCSVIEVMNPVAPLDAAAISANVDRLAPEHGATPMAAALERGAEVLKGLEGPKAIVLISDGKENCGGDPETVARRLRSQGIGVVTHVVGLGVNEEERAQLAAIASAGGGKYYAANNVQELNASLAAIKKKVITTKALFHDDFDGEAISEAWEVINPDPESMIVEKGMLQIISQVPEKKLFNARNLLLYKGDLPKEYEVEARVLMTQLEDGCGWTGGPFVGLVLKKNDNNALLLAAGKTPDCGGSDSVLFMRVKDGKWEPGFYRNIGHQQADRPVQVKLVRKDRLFTGYYLARNKQGKPEWRRLGMFPIIKADGYRLGLIAARGSGDTHEQLEKIDWVEIRKLK